MIEAAPESLELKQSLFAPLSEIVSPECVLATNTSSLLVTAAGGRGHPPRAGRRHALLQPAAGDGLLEVVAGLESSARRSAVARAAGEAMGKHVIEAVDGPGFLVNRCNRPFGLEGLKLLAERVASVEQIDRICRLGGGFRMGPFELMDLVGVDTGLDVSRSFYEQSFGEPRWRPSPITVQDGRRRAARAQVRARLLRVPGSGESPCRPIQSRRRPAAETGSSSSPATHSSRSSSRTRRRRPAGR